MSYLLEEVHRWLLSQQRRKQIPSSCGVLAHQQDRPDCKTKSVIIGRVHVNEQGTKHLFSSFLSSCCNVWGGLSLHMWFSLESARLLKVGAEITGMQGAWLSSRCSGSSWNWWCCWGFEEAGVKSDCIPSREEIPNCNIVSLSRSCCNWSVCYR